MFEVVRGGLAGIAGTLVMSVLMYAAGRAGVLGAQPPRLVVERGLAETDSEVRPGEAERDLLASLLHLVIGVGAGVGYVLLRHVLDRVMRRAGVGDWADARGTGPALGAVFGLAFWAAAYMGLAPAFGVLPPPTEDRPGRPPVMIAAHLLLGTTTAIVADRLRRS